MPVILLDTLLENIALEYTLRLSSRSRHVRISIRVGGFVTVSAPRFVQQKTIEDFIQTKAKWIISKVEHFKKCSVLDRVGLEPDSGSKQKPKTKRERHLEYLEYKDKALQIAEEKVQKFNMQYGFKHAKISIRNQKTRWGSCSRKGNLNFNYKIAFLPEHVADYLVVHEICHLGEFNHSQKFWNLVARAIPNYLELRAQLKVGPKI